MIVVCVHPVAIVCRIQQQSRNELCRQSNHMDMKTIALHLILLTALCPVPLPLPIFLCGPIGQKSKLGIHIMAIVFLGQEALLCL